MTFLVIGDDEVGTLTVMPGAPSLERVEDLVGGMGWGQLYPDRQYRMCGWASDVGLVMPDRFRRNPVAACVMSALGAPPQPLAGPIVVTGYAFDEGGWPDPIPDDRLAVLDQTYRAVRAALDLPDAGIPGVWADDSASTLVVTDAWRSEIRAYAHMVRTAPV